MRRKLPARLRIRCRTRAALGRAAHAALERLAPSFDGAPGAPEATRREVEAALAAETGGAAPDPAEVAKLVGWIDAFRTSDLGREVREAPRPDVRREQAFLLRAGRTVVRGQIDLLWRSGGRWSVLDWKTGRTDAAHGAGASPATERIFASSEDPAGTHRSEYALQMRLYALGVRAVTGVLPERLLLWSLPAGRATAVPCGADEATATERLLASFSARAAVHDWTPAASPPCADCRVRAACRWGRTEAD